MLFHIMPFRKKIGFVKAQIFDNLNLIRFKFSIFKNLPKNVVF